MIILILSLFNIKRKENKLKINKIHHMGKDFISYLIEIKIEIRRATFLKSTLPLNEYGMDFRFSGNNRNMI